ncbi:MAG: (deoxy)nucleoside triphosphate pyrophosphohydrolase [Phocaeicola sp.]
MKRIEVVAAVIYKEGSYFATQRAEGEFKGLWEFPGGKIEQGESHQEALIREIKEELAVSIAVERYLGTTESDYSAFHLTMHCYLCQITGGTIELREHADACWLDTNSLQKVTWLPADREVIEWLKGSDNGIFT